MSQKAPERMSILIVAPPSRIRDSLRAIVRATRQIEHVDVADDGTLALEAISARVPSIVLLGAGSHGWEVAVLKQIKADWPEIKCVVLANNDRYSYPADTVSVDTVLTRRLSTITLMETIAQLAS